MIAQFRARSGLAAGVVLALVLTLTACADNVGWPQPTISADLPLPPPPTQELPASPTAAPTLPPLAPLTAPTQPYPVGRRILDLTNLDRPLRTLLLFPAIGAAGGDWTVADGAFPLVLFSHGLNATPEMYERSLRPLAAAGFIVAVPTYPHTSRDAAPYLPTDLVNQPRDATAVISALLSLASQSGDKLFGHIDPTRIAASGHSAGGYTSAGLLTYERDDRVRAAVVIAGANLGGSFRDPAASVLFVHGDADEVVPYSYGRSTYDQVPWPKAFLTVLGGTHNSYLTPGTPAADVVTATVLDFLRATLYGDAEALARIPTSASVDTVTTFESNLQPTPPLQPSGTPAPTPTPSPEPTAQPSGG